MLTPARWGDWASSRTVQVRLDVTPDGGLAAGISLRGLRAVVSAADHGVAVPALLGAVAEVARGASDARAHWAEVSGEFRWILRRASDAVLLRVVHMGEARVAADDDELGHTVWEGSLPVRDLVVACVTAARTLVEEPPLTVGGGSGWTYAATRRALGELEVLLDAMPEEPVGSGTGLPG